MPLAGALALAGALSALLAPGFAVSTADKAYTVTATATPVAQDSEPADAAVEVWAGATPRISLRVANTSRNPHRLGSVDLVLPGGLVPIPGTVTITSDAPGFAGSATLSGSRLALRDLALPRGGTATVAVTTRVEDCREQGPEYVVASAAKQSNDFNGTGNDFTLGSAAPAFDVAGDCVLVFGVAPRSAQRGTDITGEVFLPFGGPPPEPAPVTVEVRDASPAAGLAAWWDEAPVRLAVASGPAGSVLGGYVEDPAPQGGVARFRNPDPSAPDRGPRIAVSASGYRVEASSPGIAAATAPSAPFDIVDVGRRCTGGQNCSGQSSAARSTARIDARATSDGDILRLSLGAIDAPAPVCADDKYAPSTDVLDFDLATAGGISTGGQRTITFTLLARYVTRAASKYNACFSSTMAFATRGGGTSPATGGGFYTGLLPDCARRSPVAPCEVGTTKSRKGDVVMTIIAPAADPRARF